jgi:hypothetical protein
MSLFERDLNRLRREANASERLRTRLTSELRQKAEESVLLTANPALRPHLYVGVQHYGSFLTLRSQIQPEGIALLPTTGIAPALQDFFDGLNADVEKMCGLYRLPPDPEPSKSGPVKDGKAPQHTIGWTWCRMVPGKRPA